VGSVLLLRLALVCSQLQLSDRLPPQIKKRVLFFSRVWEAAWVALQLGDLSGEICVDMRMAYAADAYFNRTLFVGGNEQHVTSACVLR
jgi:hypothetical protein